MQLNLIWIIFKMETKKEILNKILGEEKDSEEATRDKVQFAILQVLFDIRDLLLEETKPKGKSREDWEKQF